jgi:hypothetical protein
VYEAQAHGAERSRLQLAYEAHDLGQTTYETHHMGYLREIGRRVSILVSGEIAKCCDPVARQELRNMCSIVFMFIWWIVPMLFVCAQTGGMKILKMFPTTLTKCNSQTQLRVAMRIHEDSYSRRNQR